MGLSFWNNGLKTFELGGVHPQENKLTATSKIEVLPVPKTVSIPISQHIGVPARPVVEPRDKVKVGQVIAVSEGFISSNIHSSVSGMVTKIDKVLDATGYKRDAVIIRVEGDEWDENIDRTTEVKKAFVYNSTDIVKKIAEAGIVGLGGATFPAHVKLSVPRGKKAEYLVINGAECEPYLTSDHRLMLEHSEEIIVGIRLLMRALNVENAFVGIENNKPDAIRLFRDLVKDEPSIKIEALKVQYPQGGEKQLIKAILNREVPRGGLPIDVGVIVHNVGTAFAVYEAVQKNKPLVERVVTVTGKEIKSPTNLRVRIGTPVSDLIEAGGGLPENTGKVIAGGPMMGKALNSLDVPVTKGTSGILVLSHTEAMRGVQQACIRCGKCVEVCPMGLEPYLLMAECERDLVERALADNILDCIECGSCSYVCPSNRALLDFIRLGKKVGAALKKQSA